MLDPAPSHTLDVALLPGNTTKTRTVPGLKHALYGPSLAPGNNNAHQPGTYRNN